MIQLLTNVPPGKHRDLQRVTVPYAKLLDMVDTTSSPPSIMFPVASHTDHQILRASYGLRAHWPAISRLALGMFLVFVLFSLDDSIADERSSRQTP
jgi:hypothetical protein